MSRTSTDKISAMDMPVLDVVFGMEGGFVLDFSNRTFAEFFQEELRVDIYHPCWAVDGESKAKRLRCFLRQSNRETILDTLNALWEYREICSVARDYTELDNGVRTAFFRIIERLGGTQTTQQRSSNATSQVEIPQIDAMVASDLAHRLLQVSELKPQPRGYALEKFLKDMFDAYGLSARPSFRLVGEQIDGSFVSEGETYLLEARWTNSLVNATTLYAFNAKVENKARWSRGLLLSYSGFSPDGLTAFGSGNSVICMDGRDLHAILSRRLDFVTVLAMKVRRAAETGQPFVRVDDLSPM